MTKQKDRAGRLISAVQIAGVRLVETHARSEIRSASEVENVELRIEPSAEVVAPPDPQGNLYFLATCRVLALSSERRKPVVDVSASFELRYRIPEGFGEVTEDELVAFAGTNVIYNVWPYWREFIQATFLRLNLPPVLLPVFRASELAKASEQAAKVTG